MRKKLFVDSDIILDVLTQRDIFYESAAEIFERGYVKKVDLYTTAVVLANVFYIVRKKYGTEKSMETIRKLRIILKILPVNEKMVDEVLISKFRDFEDGLQYFSAKENGIHIIITRNINDYREKDVLIQTAEEYIKNGESFI
jgi:predicted nucleic acid-binding protein